GGTELHVGAGFLGEEPRRDPTGIVEIDDEFVPASIAVHVAVDLEHLQRRALEPDGDRLSARRHALAGTQVERHALPAPVLDLALECGERLAVRPRVASGSLAISLVLPAHDVLRVD